MKKLTINLSETIAEIGTPEQVILDFGKVARLLLLIDADHPMIGDLDKWRDILIDTIAGLSPQVKPEKVVEMVSTTLAFIAATNRPMLLARFEVYARPTWLSYPQMSVLN